MFFPMEKKQLHHPKLPMRCYDDICEEKENNRQIKTLRLVSLGLSFQIKQQKPNNVRQACGRIVITFTQKNNNRK